MKINTIIPSLKEIKTDLLRTFQQTFSDVFQQLLTDLDIQLAEVQNKSRLQFKDKRTMTMDS